MTTWRGTRACRGCDGSGFDYRNPDTSTWESFHDCLCCGGTGRQVERMPAADAVADAETLRGWLFSEHLDSLASDLLAEAGSAVEWSASDWFVASDIRRKARAAFRAVPGLREE